MHFYPATGIHIGSTYLPLRKHDWPILVKVSLKDLTIFQPTPSEYDVP